MHTYVCVCVCVEGGDWRGCISVFIMYALRCYWHTIDDAIEIVEVDESV